MRFFAPEVIQTSAMDCGPAALKSVLEGYGIHVSYGRLREACQTGVDGTSIDVLEDLANQLGVEAEQTMLPRDHLLLAASDALPAIVVARNPDRSMHFVVVWRRHGSLVQVMDPAAGRRWVPIAELLSTVFEHAMPFDAATWRSWAESDVFLGALRARMATLRVVGVETLVARAAADASWRSLAALDAATRMTDALVREGALAKGAEATALLRSAFERACAELERGEEETSIPRAYWNAAPMAGDERVLLRGAVIVRARGKQEGAAPGLPLPPELALALREPPSRPLRHAIALLRRDGAFAPALVVAATLAAAVAGLFEALLLRGMLGIALHLGTWEQRLGATLALVLFVVFALGMELPVTDHVLRMGRNLELRLRTAFLAKLPRLSDRYFSSRPASDMAHRAHAIHAVRALPRLGHRVLRTVLDMVVAGAGVVWLDRRSWPFVVAAMLVCPLVPLAAQKAMTERDLRARALHGALARFYLDALLGLVPVRAHGAARAIRREHDGMLAELRRAFGGLLAVSTSVDAVVALLSAAMSVLLVVQYLVRGGDPSGALLLVFWALSIPALGADLAAALHQYPSLRNLTERLVEPLGALEDSDEGAVAEASRAADAVAIRCRGVEVRAGGEAILRGVDLEVGAREHIAIVGASGAGKSSLCGLLLGWHSPARGDVLADGLPLRGAHLERLRRETAWVDPAVQLWNRSLLANVEYGSSDAAQRLGAVLERADLVRLLQHLPDGMQTTLGDGGALVSGGEGQRVRLARAMMKGESRLVVLDEPFRGLDRGQRAELLRRARTLWKDATLVCVTHDLHETLAFPRVLVIDGGAIVEDGAPEVLAANAGSRYARMLAAEERARREVWQNSDWRRVALRDGIVEEERSP